jgi:hypothetical protein
MGGKPNNEELNLSLKSGAGISSDHEKACALMLAAQTRNEGEHYE